MFFSARLSSSLVMGESIGSVDGEARASESLLRIVESMVWEMLFLKKVRAKRSAISLGFVMRLPLESRLWHSVDEGLRLLFMALTKDHSCFGPFWWSRLETKEVQEFFFALMIVLRLMASHFLQISRFELEQGSARQLERARLCIRPFFCCRALSIKVLGFLFYLYLRVWRL